MKLIICVDDQYGIAFDNRRQSRDVDVCDDILSKLGYNKLLIDDYSKNLFAPYRSEQVCIGNIEEAAEDDYYFAERTVPDDFSRIDEIVLYRWNRTYPATAYFPKEILKQYRRAGIEEFPGYSHEMITREVFVK